MSEALTFPPELKYMESHEWARREGDIVVVGVSDYAQDEIQDVVYVELPEVGTSTEQKKEFGVIESVKAAFDLYTPVSGEIVEINEELEDAPELVNEDPYGSGWMIKIQMNDSSELDNLLSVDEYREHIEAEQA
jgi:glycine cleavage system H protein